jgi:membrane associated rhomboid family serine protease
MFPYHDENETQRATYVTYAIIGVNVLAWLGVQGAGSTLAVARSVCDYGLIPGELTGRLAPGTPFPMGEGLVCLTDPGRQVFNVLSSMFLHGSWLHLLGNMWFLWIFGDNVERRFGSIFYVVFYLFAGIAAGYAQVLASPDSRIPNLGASGAIAGVLGAYLAMFPTNRVTIVAFRFVPFVVPAIVAIGIWALLQFVNGLGQIAQTEQTGGVAYLAHVGGFIAGFIVGLLFRGRGSGPRYGYAT